jgi:small-conductance mechanosensitive channel
MIDTLAAFANLGPLFAPLLAVGGAAVLGGLLALAVTAVAIRAARRKNASVTERIGPVLRLPLLLFLPSVFALIGLQFAGLSEETRAAGVSLLRVAIIASGAFLVTRGLLLVEDAIVARYPVEVENNLKARKVHTQIRYMRRIAGFLVFLIALGSILLTFEEIRQLGTTLLTTAGVAGIIVGFAAQKTLGMVIAGLQIAFTQPIRHGDAVVVEGEWGWVEEITLTYVVIKIWDWRRLIVPINYFLDHPIQNWTRTSARLIGSVYLYVDYGFPIQEIREALDEVLANTDLWDNGVSVAQVTDVTEKTAQVRVLVTAKDSPTLWDLRCYVREQLVQYMQSEHPDMMPRFRAVIGEQEMQDVAEFPTPATSADAGSDEPVGPGSTSSGSHSSRGDG